MKKSALILSALAAATVWALPPYGDENQPYDQLPGTLVTEHIAWANPLAGGKLRALVIIPYHLSREAIELRQRLDLDLTWVMTSGHEKWTSGYSEGGTATPILGVEAETVMARIVRERITDPSKEYDVILLAKVAWGAMSKEAQEGIRRRVENGTALVMITPDDSIPLAYDAAAEKAIFGSLPRNLPVRTYSDRTEMRKTYAAFPRERLEVAPCFVASAQMGKGRVIALDYGDIKCAKRASAIAPVHEERRLKRFHFDYDVYEFGYAAAIRAILFATGRLPATSAAIRVPERIERASLTRTSLALPVAGEVTIRRRLDLGRRAEVVFRKAVDGATALPVLPVGEYFADVIVRKDGKALDFAAASFTVTDALDVKTLTTRSDRYPAGTTIEGDFELTRSLGDGERVEVTAVDVWDRLVWRADAMPAKGRATGTFRIPVENPLCRLWDIYVTVSDGRGEIARRRTWVGVPNWTFDDYMGMHIFSVMPGAQDWKGYLYGEMMRKYGLNAAYTSILHDQPEFMEVNERTHLQSVCYSGHYGEAGNAKDSHATFKVANTNLDTAAAIDIIEAYLANGGQPLDPKEHPYRQHCLDAAEFNKKLDVYRYVGRFGTPHFCLTMENYQSGEFFGTENAGFAPRCTERFQEWCRKEYHGDLAALNREWNTDFKDWREVSGIMLVDAVLKDQTCRWLDFRYFMRREVWGGLFCALDKYIHQLCPGGYVGMGGHAQHDYTKYGGTVMTSGKLYVSQKENWEWQDAFECEMRQSMADDVGWWLGSQSSIRWTTDLNNPISRKRIPWAMLFMGLQGHDFENNLAGETFGGMSWTYPDYSGPLPFTKEITDEVQKLERGIGKLTLAAKPNRSPVAITWSPRNHYLSRLLVDQPRGFSGTWLSNVSLVDGAPNDALGLMNSIRMRPKVIRPEDTAQIAAKGFKVLILPYNKAMGEEEAKAVLSFVRGGGLVIADNEPGTYTQHGRRREQRLLAELFPTFDTVKGVRYGKGRAVYLAGLLNNYPDRMLQGNFKGADLVAGLISRYAGVTPPAELLDEKGESVRNVRFTEFDHDGARLLCYLRQHVGTMPNDIRRYTADFRGEYDVYDLYLGKYLGRHAKMELELDHYPKMLALMPAKLESATLACENKVVRGAEARFALDLALDRISAEFADAWHLTVTAPDGSDLEYYARNILSRGDRMRFSLPIALDAKTGRYVAKLTSAVTGITAECAFGVK